jgi:guanylate kinase
MSKGPLVILSGPSGSGKSTVIRRLLDGSGLPLRLSVSATTRQPRRNEQDGVHYHFWTPERFQQELARDGFLEWAAVYGNSYGTLWSEVAPYRERGWGVILDIDVQGAAQVRGRCPDCVSVFLRPPSLEELERRLRLRRTEDDAAVARRLAAARRELERAGEYDYQVVNDDLDRAVAELRALVAKLFPGEDRHAG